MGQTIRYKVIWTCDPDSRSTNLKNTEHIEGAVIYNTEYDNNDSYGTAVIEQLPYSSSSSYSPYPKPYQNHYYNEYHECILEIAKTFFNSLLDQLVDKTVVAVIK